MAAVNKVMYAELQKILKQQQGLREDGKTARTLTDVKHADVVHAAYARLEKLGFQMKNPLNISDKHLNALVKDWHKANLANKTMQDYRSRLSLFFKRIGKGPSFFKPLAAYLPEVDAKSLKVTSYAVTSKSWTELGINVVETLEKADALDKSGKFGLILRMMLAFGLRRKEALCCSPWKSGYTGHGWNVYPDESKGARPRFVPIQNPEQQRVLELALQKTKKNEKLRWETRRNGKAGDLDWAEDRFDQYMRKLGLTKKRLGGTGHGLRHEFAENAAIVAAFAPPSLSGTGAEMPKDQLKMVRLALSEMLGHSRLDIMNAYLSKFPKTPIEMTQEEYAEIIYEGVAEMRRLRVITEVPAERVEDSERLVAVLKANGSDLTKMQAHALWHQFSDRMGTLWAEPLTDGGILAAIFVASTRHVRAQVKIAEKAAGSVVNILTAAL